MFEVIFFSPVINLACCFFFFLFCISFIFSKTFYDYLGYYIYLVCTYGCFYFYIYYLLIYDFAFNSVLQLDKDWFSIL